MNAALNNEITIDPESLEDMPGARTRHRVVSRQQILDTALAEFANRGYEEATLAAIARKLGVTAPLLIYHFGSKQNLWRHAVELLFARLSNVVEAAIEDGESMDARRAVETLVRRLVYFFASHRSFHRILTREGAAPSARLDWMVTKHLRPAFGQIEIVFQRAVEEHAIKNADFERRLFMILGAASHYLDSQALVTALYGQPDTDPEAVAEYADSVVDLLFEGIAEKRDWTRDERALKAVANG